MSCCCFQCQMLGEKSDLEMVSMIVGTGSVRNVLMHWWTVRWYLWQARPWCLIPGTDMSCLQQFSLSLICYFHLSWAVGMRVGFPVHLIWFVYRQFNFIVLISLIYKCTCWWITQVAHLKDHSTDVKGTTKQQFAIEVLTSGVNQISACFCITYKSFLKVNLWNSMSLWRNVMNWLTVVFTSFI